MRYGIQGGKCLLLLFLLSAAQPVVAQEAPANEAADSLRVPPIVTDVRFGGNTFFPDAELALRIRTTPNRRFLDIPGLTWWLWVYRLGESGALGRRVGRALMASGEAPSFLDWSVISADVERLRLFYLQEGFRQAQVEVDVDTLNQGRQARVSFLIQPGEPTFIRNVSYEGLEGLTEPQQERLVRSSLLSPEQAAQDGMLSFRAQNRRYSEPVLLEERGIILDLLRNAGYAAVTRDSIRAIVFPQGQDSFDVVFRVNPGPRYRFGDVHFEVVGPEPDSPSRRDTLAVYPDTPSQPGGVVTSRVVDDSKLDPRLLGRTLQFRPGEWYDQSALLDTKRRLDATGVFAFTDIASLAVDTLATDSFAAPALPHLFDLRTRRRHQIRLETFLLQRSSVLTAGGDELGTGLGVTYENANLFGGGETFQVRLTGSVAANLDPSGIDTLGSSLFNSAQAEITTSLTYPYLIGPFRRLDGLFDLYDARTRFSSSILTARRDELLLTFTRGLGRARFELQHSPADVSLVDLIDVTFSNPDTLSGFKRIFLDEILSQVRDSVQAQQIREDYTNPQVNSALRYTFRSMTANPLQRYAGYSFETAFEIGSNLPYLLDRFVYTPDTLEGSLPGFSIGPTSTRLVYRQYFRFMADARRYHPISMGEVLAWKFIGGMAHPTGESDLVPFDRRFYSGGATGVRGWELRSLGPGATRTYQGGEIKLEGSVELRSRFIQNLFAADWSIAAFTDAGNVWLGPRNGGDPRARFRFDSFYKQIGVGSGLGLRVAWDYLILRLDLAYKAYDPARPGEGWFPDGFKTPVPHFGIGHTF